MLNQSLSLLVRIFPATWTEDSTHSSTLLFHATFFISVFLSKLLVLVLVVIGFANTRKSIGNTNPIQIYIFKLYCNTLAILKSVLEILNITIQYCNINNPAQYHFTNVVMVFLVPSSVYSEDMLHSFSRFP